MYTEFTELKKREFLSLSNGQVAKLAITSHRYNLHQKTITDTDVITKDRNRLLLMRFARIGVPSDEEIIRLDGGDAEDLFVREILWLDGLDELNRDAQLESLYASWQWIA